MELILFSIVLIIVYYFAKVRGSDDQAMEHNAKLERVFRKLVKDTNIKISVLEENILKEKNQDKKEMMLTKKYKLEGALEAYEEILYDQEAFNKNTNFGTRRN